MAAPAPDPVGCARCGRRLEPGALACEGCHALVHAAELEALAAAARREQAEANPGAAREAWTKMLDLLPPDAAQATWVRNQLDPAERARAVASEAGPTAPGAAHPPPEPAPGAESGAEPGAAGSSPQTPRWSRWLGPFAPLALLLAKGKFLLALLLKLKFILSLGTFVAVYWAIYGAWFGVGFAMLVLVHELGHFAAIKRRGLPAELPVFLPGFGAYVRWTAVGTTIETRSLVSLAGPLAGCLAAAVCAAVWESQGPRIFAGLASIAAMMNLLNLIPIWILDGGQAIAALDKTERWVLALVAAVIGVYLSQPLLLLIAGGAVYRTFTPDVPPAGNRSVLAYFLILVSALAYLMKLVPPVAPHEGG